MIRIWISRGGSVLDGESACTAIMRAIVCTVLIVACAVLVHAIYCIAKNKARHFRRLNAYLQIESITLILALTELYNCAQRIGWLFTRFIVSAYMFPGNISPLFHGLHCVSIKGSPFYVECRRGLAMRILSVCRPVCLKNASIVTKQKKGLSRFLYNTKDHIA